MKAKQPKIPASTKVWAPCNIYPSAKIGTRISIGAFTEIGKNVIIGNGTRIGKGVFIPENVRIDANCFIGPHVCFTNDRYPSVNSPKSKWEKTLVREGANIGANVTILPGITIGKDAMIGAGSVVTKNVPPGEIWAGNPAVKIGLV